MREEDVIFIRALQILNTEICKWNQYISIAIRLLKVSTYKPIDILKKWLKDIVVIKGKFTSGTNSVLLQT